MKYHDMTAILFRPGLQRILRVFYEHQKEHVHVQQLIRETRMNPHSVDRYLKILDTAGIILSSRVGNLRHVGIEATRTPAIFALFDTERFRALPDLRQHAIQTFLDRLPEKPVVAILFGSTARGSATAASDIDLLLIMGRTVKTDDAVQAARAQSGVRVQPFQITLARFLDERRLKKDAVVQSALETGYPVFNREYYHELMSDV